MIKSDERASFLFNKIFFFQTCKRLIKKERATNLLIVIMHMSACKGGVTFMGLDKRKVFRPEPGVIIISMLISAEPEIDPAH